MPDNASDTTREPHRGDPTRGRSAGTARNAEQDPTRGRSAGTARNPEQDPTRAAPPRRREDRSSKR